MMTLFIHIYIISLSLEFGGREICLGLDFGINSATYLCRIDNGEWFLKHKRAIDIIKRVFFADDSGSSSEANLAIAFCVALSTSNTSL